VFFFFIGAPFAYQSVMIIFATWMPNYNNLLLKDIYRLMDADSFQVDKIFAPRSLFGLKVRKYFTPFHFCYTISSKMLGRVL